MTILKGIAARPINALCLNTSCQHYIRGKCRLAILDNREKKILPAIDIISREISQQHCNYYKEVQHG